MAFMVLSPVVWEGGTARAKPWSRMDLDQINARAPAFRQTTLALGCIDQTVGVGRARALQLSHCSAPGSMCYFELTRTSMSAPSCSEANHSYLSALPALLHGLCLLQR